MIPLSELGERICILGPSNSGKSTLAHAIGQKIGVGVVHLDQLYHFPNTNWQIRPTGDFLTLHNQAIARPRWIIDGNYSIGLEKRLKRATGVILLDVSTPISLLRYVRRTLFDQGRYGGLEGAPERITWDMLHHIVSRTPQNRRRYARKFVAIDLPKIRLSSVGEINSYYQYWAL